MQTTTKIRHKTDQPIVYMEVYGSNRVIYRVTAGRIQRRNAIKTTYGVMLEDMRSGEQQCIEDFSEMLEQTILFANDLVNRETQPSGLYDVALEYLSDQVLSSRRIFSR